ncbi:MAG: hypothetical protein OXR67_05160 [Chloroflexota bacterium]|nr:hypothetical protein [Chloroflexota bacterium]
MRAGPDRRPRVHCAKVERGDGYAAEVPDAGSSGGGENAGELPLFVRVRQRRLFTALGPGQEIGAVGHGNELGDGYVDVVPDAGDCGADGCGENAAEMGVVALVRLMGRGSAVAKADAGPWWRVPGGACGVAAGARWILA